MNSHRQITICVQTRERECFNLLAKHFVAISPFQSSANNLTSNILFQSLILDLFSSCTGVEVHKSLAVEIVTLIIERAF